jgi:hypothetical protein
MQLKEMELDFCKKLILFFIRRLIMNEIVKKKYFLYIKIMDNFYKDDILMALESADISKASMMEGINLDNALTRNLEIFKGFFSEQVQEEKKIIIINALVDNKEKIFDFINLLKESGIDFQDKELLRVLVWETEMYELI